MMLIFLVVELFAQNAIGSTAKTPFKNRSPSCKLVYTISNKTFADNQLWVRCCSKLYAFGVRMQAAEDIMGLQALSNVW